MSHSDRAPDSLLSTDRRRFLEGLFAAGLLAGLPRVGHAGLGDKVSIKLHDKRATQRDRDDRRQMERALRRRR